MQHIKWLLVVPSSVYNYHACKQNAPGKTSQTIFTRKRKIRKGLLDDFEIEESITVLHSEKIMDGKECRAFTQANRNKLRKTQGCLNIPGRPQSFQKYLHQIESFHVLL